MDNKLTILIKEFVAKVLELQDGEPMDGYQTQEVADEVLMELDSQFGNYVL